MPDQSPVGVNRRACSLEVVWCVHVDDIRRDGIQYRSNPTCRTAELCEKPHVFTDHAGRPHPWKRDAMYSESSFRRRVRETVVTLWDEEVDVNAALP